MKEENIGPVREEEKWQLRENNTNGSKNGRLRDDVLILILIQSRTQ